ncbi:hypothetical protein R1flu_019329 [Riccia fluitans]|uniref:Uncharacterized protein n=1 Tax=Riccia fluitans TaxID=41844 RepID=A0ABD1ZKJ3_9MARC
MNETDFATILAAKAVSFHVQYIFTLDPADLFCRSGIKRQLKSQVGMGVHRWSCTSRGESVRRPLETRKEVPLHILTIKRSNHEIQSSTDLPVYS